jgi:membrane-bound ClpP family serine protease
MSIFSIAILIFVGILLFLLEFLIIPGISFAGIGGFLALAGGVFCGFYFHGSTAGSVILLISALTMTLLFYLAFKYKTWQKLSLNAMVDGKVGTLEENSVQTGDEGTTTSKLSPIGNALINNKVYEVRSEGNYIDSNKKIRIKHIDGNKIFVEIIKL